MKTTLTAVGLLALIIAILLARHNENIWKQKYNNLGAEYGRYLVSTTEKLKEFEARPPAAIPTNMPAAMSDAFEAGVKIGFAIHRMGGNTNDVEFLVRALQSNKTDLVIGWVKGKL